MHGTILIAVTFPGHLKAAEEMRKFRYCCDREREPANKAAADVASVGKDRENSPPNGQQQQSPVGLLKFVSRSESPGGSLAPHSTCRHHSITHERTHCSTPQKTSQSGHSSLTSGKLVSSSSPTSTGSSPHTAVPMDRVNVVHPLDTQSIPSSCQNTEDTMQDVTGHSPPVGEVTPCLQTAKSKSQQDTLAQERLQTCESVPLTPVEATPEQSVANGSLSMRKRKLSLGASSPEEGSRARKTRHTTSKGKRTNTKKDSPSHENLRRGRRISSSSAGHRKAATKQVGEGLH